MTDIVERLRTQTEWSDKLLREAVDEIEKIRRGVNIAWAAGLFEGEGCITCAQKHKAILNGNGERRKSGFRWSLIMHSTDHDVLIRFHEVIGCGNLYGPYEDKRSAEYKPQLRWATNTLEDSQTVLRLLLPYLGKRRREKAMQCLEATYVRKPKKTGADPNLVYPGKDDVVFPEE